MQTSTLKQPADAGADKEAQLHASLGQLLLRQERYAQAVNELTAALETRPDNAAWLASRAEAQERIGAVTKAIEDATAAVIADPKQADYAVLLGRLMLRSGHHDEAVMCYSEAIRLDDSRREHYEGLAHAFWVKGNLAAAREIYDRLRLAFPESEGLQAVTAELYIQEKEPAKAAKVCQESIDRGMKSALLYRVHGHAMLLVGDRAKAADSFRKGLAIAPEDGYLLHMLAIVTGERSERAPEDYVRAIFDTRADTYETAALFKLGVRIPGLVRREILRIRPKLDPSRPAAHKLSAILDLGCGSGLTGSMVHDLTAYLKGVDLSRGLIRYAQLKSVYHEIEIADIVASMNADPRLYECITAGDSICYFGNLKPVFEGAFKRLLPSGLFVFSLEAGPESWRADVAAGVSKDDWRLQESGRYCHALPYVEATAKAAGFEVVQVWPEILSSEDGVDLHGYLVNLRRPLS
ncbi:MAG TPA: tetratricopeptide repeat protein [Candidatus Sulfotelmatobacter sp.]|nr:tetratricopeptide repeat protein [Candidatus Sulfotelmatobacter sp.]